MFKTGGKEGELLTPVGSDVIYITLAGNVDARGRELSILLQTILSMVVTTGLWQTWAFFCRFEFVFSQALWFQ